MSKQNQIDKLNSKVFDQDVEITRLNSEIERMKREVVAANNRADGARTDARFWLGEHDKVSAQLSGTASKATLTIMGLIDESVKALNAQADYYEGQIHELKHEANLRMERVRTDTMAYAFEHVTAKLAESTQD